MNLFVSLYLFGILIINGVLLIYLGITDDGSKKEKQTEREKRSRETDE